MAANGKPPRVIVIGKEGCHLCDLVEAEIRSMAGVRPSLTVVSIDGDKTLHDRYWMRVPVVIVNGKEVFEAKMMDSEGKWKARLPSLLG